MPKTSQCLYQSHPFHHLTVTSSLAWRDCGFVYIKGLGSSHRWNSSNTSTRTEKDFTSTPSPEFPPNVAAEFSNELSRTEGNPSSQPPPSEPPPSEAATSHPLPLPSLRQATRIAISALPGQAHIVMQQQHLITRLIAARFRAWQSSRGRSKHKADTEVVPSSTPGFGRLSSKRKKSRSTRKASGNRDRKLSVSVASVEKIKADKEKNLSQHLGEHSFLKDTSIGENLSVLERPSAPQERLPNEFLSSRFPKDLQPSIEVSLGAEELHTTLKAPSIDLPHTATLTSDAAVSFPAENVEEENHLDRSELLRNYEAVLQVVLAAGIVEADAKRFLNEYRKRCSIQLSQHIEALKRLGWSEEEYSQGFSASRIRQVPAWRRLLARVLAICEEKGNYVVTIGSLASLTSIMMANMAYFRMLQLVSGSLYFTYNMTRRPPLMSAAYWNLVFFTINVLMLLRLFFETRPETFSENELDVFERHFLNTGLSPRQFKRLLSSATWRHVARGEVLVKQGGEVKELMVVCKGAVSVLMNDSEVEVLEGGDRNAIVGLKTFLSRLDAGRVSPGRAVAAPGISLSGDSSSIQHRFSPDATVLGVTSGEALPLPAAKSTASESISDQDSAPDKERFQHATAHTSVVVAKDVLLLVWPMDELMRKVNSDPTIALPLVGGFARSLVARTRNQSLKQNLTSYATAIKGALADGVAGTEEKRFLMECRQKFNVSEEQHWALVEQLGWTREEFEFGSKGTVAAIRGILVKMKDQIGLFLPTEALQSTNPAKDTDIAMNSSPLPESLQDLK